jgi:hypothetical protein
LTYTLADLGFQDVKVEGLAPASFGKIDKYLDDPAHAIEGSVMVLQMGNYEAIRGTWRAPVDDDNSASTAEPADIDGMPPVKRMWLRWNAFSNFALQCLKLGVFLAREATGTVYFDKVDFAIRLSRTFSKLAARKPARVIVLAALTANSVELNLCRRRLNVEMKKVAAVYGFTWIDAYGALVDAALARRKSMVHDLIHLNIEGHKVVAQALAPVLGEALAEAGV